MRTYVTEHDIFITNDGIQYPLAVGVQRVILSVDGMGMPEIDYITERGPYQDGESIQGMFLKPRVVQYIIRNKYCSRQAYWNGRAEILNILRPNRPDRTAQGTLRKILPSGAIRDLLCKIQSGPSFAPHSNREWDQWAFTDTLKFIAYNPIWFDPHAYSVIFTSPTQLVFPITFPITFQTMNEIQSITYAGTWDEYPIITATGPFTSLLIQNLTTGDEITINYPVLVGQSITIDLSFGVKTVTLNDGTNLIGTVVAGSNLATFKLLPGVNTVQAVADFSGAATSVTLSYHNRYIGV